MIEYRIIILTLTCLTAIMFSYSFIASSGNWFPLSDRYAVNYLFFAKTFINDGRFYYVNPLNEKYDPIFVPDHFVQKNEKTLPFGFYGFIFLLSLFYLISEKIIWLSVPLTGLIAIAAIYVLVSTVLDKKTATVSAFLLAFSPAYLYHTNSFVADIPAFMFLVLALLYFLRMIDEPKRLRNYLLFSIFFSWSILMRYPNALLLIAFVPSIFSIRKKLKVKHLILGLLVFAISISPFFVLNIELFGGPFNLGIRSPYVVLPGGSFADVDIPQNAGFLQSIYIPDKNFKSFLANITVYVIKFEPLTFLLSILFLLLIFRFKNKYSSNQKRKLFHFVFIQLLITLILVAYYAGGKFGFSWSSEPVVKSSLVRYFIPVYATFIIFASYLICEFSKVKTLKYIAPILISLMIINSFFTVFIGKSAVEARVSLPALTTYISECNEVREYVKKFTEEDAIIFTKYSAWIFFPERNVANYLLYPREDNINKTTQLIIRLINDNKTVYFLEEDWYWLGPKAEQYFSHFREHGLDVVFIKKFSFSGFYSKRPITLYKIVKRGDIS